MANNKRWFKAVVSVFAAAVVTGVVFAQDDLTSSSLYWMDPVSNPVYLDTAKIKPQFDVVYMYQTLPSHVNVQGMNVPLDGDMNVVSLQLEYPLTERLAIVANKTGYIDFNPSSTLSKEEGYADIAAGLKYAFWWPFDNERLTCAARATVEVPFADEEVFQDNGEGNISPALLATYESANGLLPDRKMAVNSVLGGIIPFNNNRESTMAYAGVSFAQQLTPRLTSMLEMNYFHVIEDGEGEARFGQGNIDNIVGFSGGLPWWSWRSRTKGR